MTSRTTSAVGNKLITALAELPAESRGTPEESFCRIVLLRNRTDRVLHHEAIRESDAESMAEPLRSVEKPLITPRTAGPVVVENGVDEFFISQRAIASHLLRPFKIFGIAYIQEFISRCDLSSNRIQMIRGAIQRVISAEEIGVPERMDEFMRMGSAEGNHAPDSNAVNFRPPFYRRADEFHIIRTDLVVIVDESNKLARGPAHKHIAFVSDGSFSTVEFK